MIKKKLEHMFPKELGPLPGESSLFPNEGAILPKELGPFPRKIHCSLGMLYFLLGNFFNSMGKLLGIDT
jgi:hypothetical protein